MQFSLEMTLCWNNLKIRPLGWKAFLAVAPVSVCWNKKRESVLAAKPDKVYWSWISATRASLIRRYYWDTKCASLIALFSRWWVTYATLYAPVCHFSVKNTHWPPDMGGLFGHKSKTELQLLLWSIHVFWKATIKKGLKFKQTSPFEAAYSVLDLNQE